MAKYIKTGTKYAVSVAYSQDRRQQQLDAICAEEQVKLYYPTVLGIAQAITNYAIGQPSPEIYHGTIMKEWGRSYPYGQDEFNRILDLLVQIGFLKKGKATDNPLIVTYSSVDDLERRQRMEEENARVRESMRKTRENKKTEARKLENLPEETDTKTKAFIENVPPVAPENNESEPEEIETAETIPDETETESEPEAYTLALSGFEAKMKGFREKNFRKNPPIPTPKDTDSSRKKSAERVLTRCEQQQPETSPQGKFYAGGGGYWDDCTE